MATRFRLAYAVLIIFTLASLSAELVSNDRPLVVRHHGDLLFPVLKHYPPERFGQSGRVRTAYREVAFTGADWALWPPNRWGPFERNDRVGLYPSPPATENWLGTDDRGRDVLARLLYGYRNSLGFAVLTWALCTAIAILVGATTGFFGGRVDFLGQRLVELVTSVPQMFVLVYLISLVTPSLSMLVLVTGLLSWTYLSTFVRAEVLRQRQMLFVEAARANGAGVLRTLVRHVLPNSVGTLGTLAPFVIVENISALAALDFLGFGLPPPAASWGELLAQGHANFSTAWWLAVYPTLALVGCLVSISLVGEHLRHRPR